MPGDRILRREDASARPKNGETCSIYAPGATGARQHRIPSASSAIAIAVVLLSRRRGMAPIEAYSSQEMAILEKAISNARRQTAIIC